MGSDLAMSVLLPKEMNAASSPMFGPSNILGSGVVISLRKLASRSAGSLPALSRLFASSSVIRFVPSFTGLTTGFRLEVEELDCL